MQTLELLYEGQDVQVLGRRAGDTAVISFSAGSTGGVFRPFADGLMFKGRLTTVHIISKRNHWWQTDERSAATKATRDFLEGHTDRVTFGGSMGGYGALAWANDVGATRIVAVAPQTTLRGPLDDHWIQLMSENGVDRNAVADGIPEQAVPLLLYDPDLRIDAFHAEWLSQRRNVSHVRAKGAGHSVLKGLLALGVGRIDFGPVLKGEMSADDLQARIDHTCATRGTVAPL